jgi:hypothetical protein
MKRKSEAKSGGRFGDILQSTSLEQRAWIGAVALAYNDAESALHKLAASCLITGCPPYSIISRINGSEGIIAIIDETVAGMGMSADLQKLFKGSLEEHGFAYLKGLRDAVIHAQLFDSSTGLATAPGKRGKRREEVLLSSVALEGLYQRLVILRRELRALETITSCTKAIRLMNVFGAIDDQRLKYNEQDIQAAISQCRLHQTRRQSLPQFPKFPEPPEMDELLQKWRSEAAPKSVAIHLRDD